MTGKFLANRHRAAVFEASFALCARARAFAHARRGLITATPFPGLTALLDPHDAEELFEEAVGAAEPPRFTLSDPVPFDEYDDADDSFYHREERVADAMLELEAARARIADMLRAASAAAYVHDHRHADDSENAYVAADQALVRALNAYSITPSEIASSKLVELRATLERARAAVASKLQASGAAAELASAFAYADAANREARFAAIVADTEAARLAAIAAERLCEADGSSRDEIAPREESAETDSLRSAHLTLFNLSLREIRFAAYVVKCLG
jgi:hypothetical protein